MAKKLCAFVGLLVLAGIDLLQHGGAFQRTFPQVIGPTHHSIELSLKQRHRHSRIDCRRLGFDILQQPSFGGLAKKRLLNSLTRFNEMTETDRIITSRVFINNGGVPFGMLDDPNGRWRRPLGGRRLFFRNGIGASRVGSIFALFLPTH